MPLISNDMHTLDTYVDFYTLNLKYNSINCTVISYFLTFTLLPAHKHNMSNKLCWGRGQGCRLKVNWLSYRTEKLNHSENSATL